MKMPKPKTGGIPKKITTKNPPGGPKTPGAKKKKVTARQALKNTAAEMGKASKKTAVKRGISAGYSTKRKSLSSMKK